MAIQTGRPLGFVIGGAGIASTVMSFGDATSTAELGAMVVDASVATPMIEAAAAFRAPAVFSPDVAERVAKMRGEMALQQPQLSMAGPMNGDDGNVSGSRQKTFKKRSAPMIAKPKQESPTTSSNTGKSGDHALRTLADEVLAAFDRCDHDVTTAVAVAFARLAYAKYGVGLNGYLCRAFSLDKFSKTPEIAMILGYNRDQYGNLCNAIWAAHRDHFDLFKDLPYPDLLKPRIS